MYCPEQCGVSWTAGGRKRVRRIIPLYESHYMRKHVKGEEE